VGEVAQYQDLETLYSYMVWPHYCQIWEKFDQNLFANTSKVKTSAVTAYTNSNPVARKGFTFPYVLLLFLFLIVKLFLAIWFEFGTT
jgi:hypothetical protein